jgi:hypothetical protein
MNNIYFSKKIFFEQKENKNINDIFYKNLYKYIYNLYKDNTNFSKLTRFEDFDEYSRFFKKNYSGKLPVRLIKLPFQYSNDLNFFKIRFNDNTNNLSHKIPQDTIYFTLKQKRYNRKKVVTQQNYISSNNVKKYSGYPYLSKSNNLDESIYNPTIQYKLLKKNKNRSEMFSIYSNKRLLRTKKILVLPAHVNITVITNSYDIVHS